MGVTDFVFDWNFKTAEEVRGEMWENEKEKYPKLREIVYCGIDEAAGKGLMGFNVRLNGFGDDLIADVKTALNEAGYDFEQQKDLSWRVSWEKKTESDAGKSGDSGNSESDSDSGKTESDAGGTGNESDAGETETT